MLRRDAPFTFPGIGRGRRAITGADTVIATDRGTTIDATSGTFSLALTAAATLGSGFHCAIYNSGSGTVTIDPAGTETIRAATGTATTLALTQGQGVVLMCDGSNWKVIASIGLPWSPSTPITVYDNAFTILDNVDPTKTMVFSLGSMATGNDLTFSAGAQTGDVTATLPVITSSAIFTMSSSALTSGRVPFVTTGGLLTDSAQITATVAGSTSMTFGTGSQDAFNFFNGSAVSAVVFQIGSVSQAQIRSVTTGIVRITNGGASATTAEFDTAARSLTIPSTTGTTLVVSSTASNSVTLAGGITIAGNISQTGATTFSTGTGAVSLNGTTTVSRQLNVALGTITASESLYNGTVTWNNAGVTFNGFNIAVTNTASGADSTLMNMSVGGSAMFTIMRDGTPILSGSPSGFPSSTYDSSCVILRTGSTGSAPFDQAGSLIYRTRLSATAGRSSHLFYTGSTPTKRMEINELGSVIVGSAALATSATDGFLYVPTCAGTPTGAPTAKTGTAPIVIDSTNNKLYFYSGGAWRDAGP